MPPSDEGGVTAVTEGETTPQSAVADSSPDKWSL